MIERAKRFEFNDGWSIESDEEIIKWQPNDVEQSLISDYTQFHTILGDITVINGKISVTVDVVGGGTVHYIVDCVTREVMQETHSGYGFSEGGFGANHASGGMIIVGDKQIFVHKVPKMPHQN